MKLVSEPKKSTAGSSCDSCTDAQTLQTLLVNVPKSSLALVQIDNGNDD